MNRRIECTVALCLLLLVTPSIRAAPSATDAPRKAAIFTVNRADKVFDDKLGAFEDFITGRITEKGFSIISREIATDALSSLMKDSKQTDADQLLSSNSSVLRLGQLLGADYLITASISSFGSEKKTSDAYGIKTVNVTHTLRVTYKVLDGTHGGTVTADTVKANKTTRFTEKSSEEDGDLINGLLEDAAGKVAESVGAKEIRMASTAKDKVEFSISCGMQDLAQVPMNIPDVRISATNTLIIEEDGCELQALDVTVELDGVVIGSAPASFKAAPGLHKIRLSREGFKPWERTMEVTAGQKLKVALQMSEAGYSRWTKSTAFLFGLKTGEKLTDGTVKMMEGFAQTLRQSGYRVDTRADLKANVDVKTDVKANLEAKGKSLFDGATLKLLGN